MSIRPDFWIRKMAKEHGMIEPFADNQVRKGSISYGISAYGYDMRISNEFKILRVASDLTLDPKNMPDDAFENFVGDVCVIPPHGLILAKSVEYFRIPRNILTVTQGKSTYARVGVLVNVTPFEPEWEGFVTIAITNLSGNPVKVYANEGLAQVLFFESEDACEKSYADKKGKYQAQKTITGAKII
ncbi:dCTP deaminase [bacterium]|nr:dCTP deaminase [bacterium]MBL7052575.1 dCTP deaminase [Candidatus Neomarinimicrobiota bacterium]